MDVVILSYDPGPWWYYVPALKNIILWLKVYSFSFLPFNNGILLMLSISVVFLALFLIQMWVDVYYSQWLRWIGFLLIVLTMFLYFCGVLPFWWVVLMSIIYFFPILLYIVSFQI